MGLPNWVLGIGIGVFSKAVASLGLVLQKRWHCLNSALPLDKRKAWYLDLWWMAGFATYAGGNLITIAALALAPQTVIAALDSLVLVFNAIWAPWMLNEHPCRSDWIWNAVIISGVALVVVYGPPMGGDHSGRELMNLLIRPAYIIFAGSSLCIFCAAVLYRTKLGDRSGNTPLRSFYHRQSMSGNRPPSPLKESSVERRKVRRTVTDGTPGGVSPGTTAADAQGSFHRCVSALADDSPRTVSMYRGQASTSMPGPDPAAAVAAGVAPAVLSCFCLQLSKVMGELIADTARGANEFGDWPVYLFILALIGVNSLQVKMLQAALIDFSALVVVPVFQVGLTIFAVVGGGIYFKEFDAWGDHPPGATWWECYQGPLFFSCGLSFAVLGVVCLSLRGSNIPDRIWGMCCREKIVSPAVRPGPGESPVSAAQRVEVTELTLLNPADALPAGQVLNYSLTKVPWCEVSSFIIPTNLQGASFAPPQQLFGDVECETEGEDDR
eukprot:TRINITY_DN2298_c0_g1_i1.p1 TRINITY_DN2298_c0_g1~~TRINITY_DN2298_c0_g1_i1.p1  ORF type:complete len:528 (+),score=147.98 TRINITY_DN2298_c0_g1_i1:99-1586(+)